MSDFPPIASLRSFEAVARLGSVTLAAERTPRYPIPQSAADQTAGGDGGRKALYRQGRGVQINEEGRLYALQVRGALNHIADATGLYR